MMQSPQALIDEQGDKADGFRIVAEGFLETARLTVNHVATEPDNGGPRVLLLGGSNFDLRLKRGFLKSQLAQRCSILTFEPRGIGQSDQPVGDWFMRDYAEDAFAVLDAAGWSDAIVVAESFGAMTALHMAVLQSNRIKALVLASGTAGGAGGGSYDITEFLPLSRADAAHQALLLQDTRNRKLERDNPDAFARKLEARIKFEEAFFSPSISSGGYARLLAARAKNDVWASLPEIDVPSLVLAGRFDEQAPLKAQKSMAEALPNARFEIFSAGHGLLFTEPTVMSLIVDQFLLEITC